MRFEKISLRGLGPFRGQVDLDLSAVPGTVVAFTGENGAGKSTLLELLPAALYRETKTRGSLADLAKLAVARDSFLEVHAVNGKALTIRHTIDGVSGAGEVLLLDEAGAPILADGKRRTYDAWAKVHLPAAEVLYASIFSAQGGKGCFLDMSPGESRRVLTRALGVDHLERLAEIAREDGRSAKAELETLVARLADEDARAEVVASVAADVAAAKAGATAAELELGAVREALAAAERDARTAEESNRRREELLRTRAALEARIAGARLLIEEQERQMRADSAILARRGEIQAAVARAEELGREATTVRLQLERARSDARSAEERQSAARERGNDAGRRRARAAQAMAERRREIESQIAKLEEREADLGRRLENNRAVVAEADAIRQAVTRSDELTAQVATLERDIDRLGQDRKRAMSDAASAEVAAVDAGHRCMEAGARARRAAERLVDADAIALCASGLAGAGAAARALDLELETRTTTVDALRRVALTSAEERAASLRTSLTGVVEIADAARLVTGVADARAALGRAATTARSGITADDDAVRAATAAPAQLLEAVQRLDAARCAKHRADEALDAARRAADQVPGLLAGAEDIEDARRDEATQRQTLDRIVAEAIEAHRRASRLEGEIRKIEDLRRELLKEASGLVSLREKAPRLATAEGRIRDLEEQAAGVQAEAAEANAVLVALPDRWAAEIQAAEQEAVRADTDIEDAKVALAAAREAVDEASFVLSSARAEEADLAPVTSLVEDLARAVMAANQLSDRVAAAQETVAAGVAELAALEEPPAHSPVPPLDNLRLEVRRAEHELQTAGADVAVAQHRLDAARAAAERRTALEGDRAAVEERLADLNLLADGLGPKGVQALIIDSAGPELTELANDLLRTCFGPRWTVSIETTRPSSDGKKEIETCEVRVIDTERGREGAAETLSGGERVIVGEAISLAISMLACRRAGIENPTLVRDESGAALSAANGRQYIGMLRRAAELVGASKVFFVSHVPELQELADARIEVSNGRVEVLS